jgi:hypothetical protein
MRQILYVATVLSFGLGSGIANSSLEAQQTSVGYKTNQDYSTSTTEPSANSQTGARSSEETKNQAEMAAWMIESAQVAKDYVEGLDRGQYSQSWSKGDQLFQHTISQNEWTQALDLTRKGLGRVISRTVKLQNDAWDPRGLPKGPYMVVEYDTSFQNAPHAVELLTLRRGSDGKWRVLTYNVN